VVRQADKEAGVVGESRWPMAAAVVAAIVGTILMPRDQRLLPPWVIPVVEGTARGSDRRGSGGNRPPLEGAPGGSRSRSYRSSSGLRRWRRRGSSTSSSRAASRRTPPATCSRRARLSGPATSSPSRCSMGARRRWRGSSRPRHARLRRLRLPAADDPELAPADWRPRFVDYLYLAFTNATAFSPTDAMPIAHRAKLGMLVQSLASLAILGLVIARAVNVLA
jgi:hypothetical protein